jgi:KDO2-lipid IV(A) lauroyltransferase
MDRRTRDDVVFHLLRGVLGTGSRVPLRLSRPIGALAGRLALPFAHRERRRMRSHLEIAFPELERGERVRIMRGCARHFGQMLAEIAWLWRADASDVGQLVQFEGLDHLFRALAEGRGVVLATGHIGNWELLNAGLSVAGVPISVVVRGLDDPRMDSVVTELRTRFGSEVIVRGTTAGRQLVRALGSRRTIGLLIDQDIPSIPGVFVPFFGRPAWTPSGAAMLALRMRSTIVPGFIHRTPDGRHKARIGPPLDMPVEGSLEDRVAELTAAATAAVEWQVRAWPEQWVWMHRRWRTRAGDEDAADRDVSTPGIGDSATR